MSELFVMDRPRANLLGRAVDAIKELQTIECSAYTRKCDQLAAEKSEYMVLFHMIILNGRRMPRCWPRICPMSDSDCSTT